jgi:hypothetical protein
VTTTTDSLLHDFARSNDRHLEAARRTIAPEVQEPKKAGSTPPPENTVTAGGEKPKEVK